MVGKALRRVLVPVTMTLLVTSVWTDLVRYLKIIQVSARPEAVPAEGRRAYPQSPDRATPDGTGDFDSALRGGPARAA